MVRTLFFLILIVLQIGCGGTDTDGVDESGNTADCVQSETGAFSSENYRCEEHRCVYTGCRSTAECLETYDDERYICSE